MQLTLKHVPFLFALSAALLSSGCAVGPDYERPAVQMADSFRGAALLEGWKQATPSENALKGEWWTLYGDEDLNALIKQVEVNNQNVAQYVQRYRMARADLSSAEASLFPTVSLNGQIGRSKSGSLISNRSSLQGQVSWMPDIWGKLRRQAQSNRATAEASLADLANATLSAQATLARSYLQLRVLDKRVSLFDETIQVYENNLRTITNKYQAGTAVKTDVTQASQSLDSARSSRAALKLSRAKLEHAIAVLVGQTPESFSIPVRDAELPKVPAIPPALPSSLLERRPDIASAERAVAAANESIGIAIAGYFPDLTLSASGGYSKNSLHNLFSADNLVWSLGASAAMTILDFGKTSASVERARANYERTVAAYRQTVLQALQNVEDCLVSSVNLSEQLKHTTAAYEAAKETSRIMHNQYDAGMIDYTDVSSRDASRISAQQNLLSLYSSSLENSVTLIESLGGGWEGLAAEEPGKAQQ